MLIDYCVVVINIAEFPLLHPSLKIFSAFSNPFRQPDYSIVVWVCMWGRELVLNEEKQEIFLTILGTIGNKFYFRSSGMFC